MADTPAHLLPSACFVCGGRAIGAAWYSKLDAQKAADKLAENAKHGEEFEVVFQEAS